LDTQGKKICELVVDISGMPCRKFPRCYRNRNGSSVM